jgi:hypothetical protein
MMKLSRCLAAALAVSVWHAAPAHAQDTQAILKEIQALKKDYEARISQLESKLQKMGEEKQKQAAATPASTGRSIYGNSFNPAIGVVLNGQATSFSENMSEIAGFGVGEEGERGGEGRSLGESELNFSANIDDKFYGSTTAAIVREDGSDIVELEEAYVQTLPGIGLPAGARATFGRKFWTLGYLNEHHAHGDDFADRPLPYRVYLNKSFNDDGVEVSYVLPTDFYAEIGGGAFRADDFPAGGSVKGLGAWSLFGRIGSDIGDNQSWRFGGYYLNSDATDRKSNEDMVTFIGESRLIAADLRYTLAPTGDASQSELILQAEVFQRSENGTYEDADAGTGRVIFDDSTRGWYAQGVYKFAPAWRIGARYSQMLSTAAPAGLVGSALDPGGHDPHTISVMADWTNSEFGRIRLQYNHEELSSGADDDQLILQYVMSIGAHGAHAY